MSISEDHDEEAAEQTTRDGVEVDPDEVREPSSLTKWGMAGLLVVYAGLGTYCVATTLGGGAGSPLARSDGSAHPEGVSRSVAAALAQPTVESGSSSTESAAAPKASSSRGGMSAARRYAGQSAPQAATPPPAIDPLTAVSAVAIGPSGAADGDHPELAPYAIDPHSGMSWVTHWYTTAHFGNLQKGTGLLLDMGKTVTIRQVELALGGSPGFWGADLQIRIGDTPNLTGTAPVATATDVGGWVSQDLGHAVTGRYVQIWFTKLPLDTWGTFQEHVYGVKVRGYVPAPHPPATSPTSSASTTAHTVHLGREGNDPGSHGHRADPRARGGYGPAGQPVGGHRGSGAGYHGHGGGHRDNGGGYRGHGDGHRGHGDGGHGGWPGGPGGGYGD
ncbi:MAG TPA: hypothetical protein VMU95_00995 [Trebonia sp.]|nr:hypothetical protein [Trebonia sp.]